MKTNSDHVNGRSRYISGEELRCVAIPIGGIGAGTIALCGDGSFRQWQIVNQVNHRAYVPHSFFAVRARDTARVLISDALYDDHFDAADSVSDHLVPEGLKQLLKTLPGIQGIGFDGLYPVARVTYHDDAAPIDLRLHAYSPFRERDAHHSGGPIACFDFVAKNLTSEMLPVSILAALQNSVGWDGVCEIRDTESHCYGGNINVADRSDSRTQIILRSIGIEPNSPFYGEMCLSSADPRATVCEQWDSVERLWEDFAANGTLTDAGEPGPSRHGSTWNSAICSSVELGPGETRSISFAISWWFPHRYVNWSNFGHPRDGKSRLWVGNAYSKRTHGAAEIAQKHFDREDDFDVALEFERCFRDSTLPQSLIECIVLPVSTLRSPVCFLDEKGGFFGFEGGCGASAGGLEAVGGCCPLNCTHVWNYEQALGYVFPSLARTMRETDWLVQQHPSGYLPHRVVLPRELPRLWETVIGGPDNPAADGLFAGVLKTLREFRVCGDRSWLERMWPAVSRAMSYAMSVYDSEGDGVIRGEQPNTYDIHVYGPNTFIGSQYLAALRAAEEMAMVMGDGHLADSYRRRFESGSELYDSLCWNGEYYEQIVEHARYPEHQWGAGCLADQLLGQWWAHTLGLGYILPKDHVRSAVESIFRHNLRRDFNDFTQAPRVFASAHDSGLLNCTWPRGGRPDKPILYSDEVWTGIEYAVATLLIYEGFVEEALTITGAVRDRYSGRFRNPYNEVECGDHYVRALSGWSLLLASSGCVYDGHAYSLTVMPRLVGEFHVMPIFASGTAMYEQQAGHIRIAGRSGSLTVRALSVPLIGSPVAVSFNGNPVTADIRYSEGALAVRLTDGPVTLSANDVLELLV